MESTAGEWVREAEDNLTTAKILYHNERFKDSAYYCHQVVEKALKSVQIEKLKRFDMVHDLVRLAKSVDAPRGVIIHCEKLTKYYVPTKYPILKRQVPNEKEAESSLAEAEEVLEWAKSTLKS